MILVPVIWFKQGVCVEVCSEKKKVNLFEDPLRLARLWRIQNAKALQLELGGEEASASDLDVVEEICQGLDIPIMISLPRHLEYFAERAIELGVSRVILDRDLADEDLVDDLKNMIGLRKLALRFTLEADKLAHSKDDILKIMVETNSSRFILKVDECKSEQIGSLMKYLKEEGCRARLSLQTEIKDYHDLNRIDEMKAFGVDSLILPKSIYSNLLPCQKMWCWNDPMNVDTSQVSTAKLRDS